MTIEDEIKKNQGKYHHQTYMIIPQSDHKKKEEKELPSKHLKIIVLSFVTTKKIQIMKSESM